MSGRVVVLTGGVGGAKLVLGLSQVIPPSDVIAVVNTGDDFAHLGLHVSPDIDTQLYTLSGQADAAQGWGREGETWQFMNRLCSLGGPDWFALGDGDLALHVLRTERLRQDESLSAITADFARSWGLEQTILPMSDLPVETRVLTDEGDLAFQTYFVERRCRPVVRELVFRGAEAAAPAPGVCEAILSAKTRAVLIAPSNPYLSVDPILAVPGIREALANTLVPVVAISPIVGGEAVKGPTAKLMRELGLAVTSATIAAHYRGLIDAMLLDQRDAVTRFPIPYAVCDTLMHSLADRARVAEAALELAGSLR